jgi:protein gp37
VGAKTKIEWCDATWNPITGCTPVSAGCEHCYAKRLAERFPHVHSCARPEDRPIFQQIVFHHDRIDAPLHWRKPKKIFVCSMGDLFHERVLQNCQHEIYDVIQQCPQHIFMILTKRPENISTFYNHMEYDCCLNPVLPNLWLGVTAENQEMADRRIPILLQIPAAKKFVSVEPMLGPVDLKPHLWGKNGHYSEWIDWIICGPETGSGKRFCDFTWAIELATQCKIVGIPFFDKTKQGLLGKQWPVSK